MREDVAIVGAGGAVGAALLRLAAATPGLRVALAAERASADEVATALDGAGTAFLALPEGDSRELGRALVARGVRVIDLGRDQRLLPHVACGFGGGAASSGKRLLALPSAGAMAAWLAAAPLVRAGLLDPDRLSLLVVAGRELDVSEAPRDPAGAALEAASARLADELAWLFDQHGWPLERATSAVVRAPAGFGLLAIVQGDLGHEDGADPAALQAALDRSLGALRSPAEGGGAEAPERLCSTGEQADSSRVAGTGVAEIAARVDGFAERITASCALDAVSFVAHEALRALARARGAQPGSRPP